MVNSNRKDNDHNDYNDKYGDSGNGDNDLPCFVLGPPSLASKHESMSASGTIYWVENT